MLGLFCWYDYIIISIYEKTMSFFILFVMFYLRKSKEAILYKKPLDFSSGALCQIVLMDNNRDKKKSQK
ncbi:hypothetical protein CBF36_11370 [Vagococcus bubulae]|uniref:Uncharacterized protein n=1 Tax=Vagococcus bubulae TaxID=1977868 RepID=A0A429ZAC5_9ENTE|nr:hypothetical protein CBF36_11370 [Vagococcus bubulae]